MRDFEKRKAEKLERLKELGDQVARNEAERARLCEKH
jgi:hypothetical protein